MRKVTILLAIFCLATIIFGKYYWDNKLKENQIEANANNVQMEKEQKKEEQNYSELYKRILNNKVKRIKLVGDSITAGVGASGYNIPPNGKIIFDNGKGETYREANYTTNSWANNLRNYMNRYFPKVEVVNAGIPGKSATWAKDNKAFLVSKEDVVFVMLGTNDRYDGDISKFKQSLEEFLDYVNKNSNLMIVMSPPPALNDNQFRFGAKEINDVVKEVCTEHNYKFLSQYENMMNYSKNNNIELNKLLQTTGSHPIDAGYKVMWQYIESDLNLDKQNSY